MQGVRRPVADGTPLAQGQTTAKRGGTETLLAERLIDDYAMLRLPRM